MESAPRFSQWLIELQRFLWLCSPILHRQAVLAVVADEFRAWLGGYGYDAALSRQHPLFSSRCSALLSSHAWMPALKASLHWLWCADTPSQPAGLTLPAFISRWQTSLKRRRGLPVGLVPMASSPSMSLGIVPSSMRLTWPSQRSRLTEQGEHTGHPCLCNDIVNVWDTVLLGDAQNLSEEAQVEGVESALLAEISAEILARRIKSALGRSA